MCIKKTITVLYFRYFGLTKLVNINETDPTSFTYEVTLDHMWATLASPFIILFTYYILGLETRELFKPKVCLHAAGIMFYFE